ncbi:MAG TPA: phage tail tip lysozyme [Candidatus Saccharimonadales bacterium]|nr:phage tail tip lysozyme [Candidatus Saccharimonadales bacterium]
MLGMFGGKRSAEVAVIDAAPATLEPEMPNSGFVQIDPNIANSNDNERIVRMTIEAYKANAKQIIADMTVDDLVERASNPSHPTLLRYYEERGANGQSVFEPYVDAYMRVAGQRMVPSSFRPGQQWSVLTEQAHKSLERIKKEHQTIDQPPTDEEKRLAFDQVRAAATNQCLRELKGNCLEPFVRSQIRTELVRNVERLAHASDAAMSDEDFNNHILPVLAKYHDQDPSKTFALAKSLHTKYLEECARQCKAMDQAGKKGGSEPDFQAAHRLAAAYHALGMSDTRVFKTRIVEGVSEKMSLQEAKVRHARSYAANDLERINQTYEQKRLKLRGNEAVRETARRTHAVHNYLLRSDMLNAKEVAYEINERTGVVSVVRQSAREGAERAAAATAQIGGQIVQRTTETMRGIDLKELVEGKAIKRGVAGALIAGGALSTMMGGGTARAAESHTPVVAEANYTQPHADIMAGFAVPSESSGVKQAAASLAESLGRISAAKSADISTTPQPDTETPSDSTDSVSLDIMPVAFETPAAAPEVSSVDNAHNYKGLFGPKSQHAYSELMRHNKGNIVEERKAAAMKIYLESGISAKVAAAMVGNFVVESAGGLEPSKHQIGGGPGRGIAQWSVDGRWAALLRWADAHDVSPYLFDTQVRFSVHELKTSYAHALSAAEAADSIYGATLAIEKYYEIPADVYESDNLRARYAQDIFERFMHYVNQAPAPHPAHVAPPHAREPVHKVQQPPHRAAPSPSGAPHQTPSGHVAQSQPSTASTIGDVLDFSSPGSNKADTASTPQVQPAVAAEVTPKNDTVSGVIDSLPSAEAYTEQPPVAADMASSSTVAASTPPEQAPALDTKQPPADTVVGILDSISNEPAYSSPFQAMPAVAKVQPGTVGSIISDTQPQQSSQTPPDKQGETPHTSQRPDHKKPSTKQSPANSGNRRVYDVTREAGAPFRSVLQAPNDGAGHDVYYTNQVTDLSGVDGINGEAACSLASLLMADASLNNNPSVSVKNVHQGLIRAGAYSDSSGVLDREKYFSYIRNNLHLKSHTILEARTRGASDNDLRDIKETLDKGGLIIAHSTGRVSGRLGRYAYGHYFVIYGYDNKGFYVANPGEVADNDYPFSGHLMKGWADGFYAVSK